MRARPVQAVVARPISFSSTATSASDASLSRCRTRSRRVSSARHAERQWRMAPTCFARAGGTTRASLAQEGGVHDHGKSRRQQFARQFVQSCIGAPGRLRAVDIADTRTTGSQHASPNRRLRSTSERMRMAPIWLQRQLGKSGLAGTGQSVRDDQCGAAFSRHRRASAR